MKLISCHIEDFGTLHDFDFVFTDGINVIHHENGWGKSTLASFIRVMFYGFENETKKNTEDRERGQKYPWQKGVFGGSLTFEANGKRYRIVRTFDEKKSAKDTFELFDDVTGLPSSDYTGNVGEELFDIDSDSFQRTVFIAQNDCGSYATDRINAKIGNISRETADMGNYETVIADLNSRMNKLTEKRATGQGRKLKERIAELETGIVGKQYHCDNVKDIQDRLSSASERLSKCESEEKTLNTQIAEAARVIEQRANRKVYEKLKSDLDGYEAELNRQKACFTKEIPSIDTLNHMASNASKYETDLARSESYALTSKEKLSLEQFETVFEDGIPDPDTISLISSNVAEYELIRQEIRDNRMSDNEIGQMKQLQKMFAGKEISEKHIDDMVSVWNENEKRKIELSVRLEQSRKKSFSVPLVIAAVVMVMAGVICAVLKYMIPAAVLCILAAVTAVAGFMKKPDTSETDALREEIRKTEEEVYAFLRSFDMNCENAIGSLYSLSTSFRQLEALETRYRESSNRQLSDRQTALEHRLHDFFTPYYGEKAGYGALLQKMQNDINEYDALVEKNDRYTHACMEVQSDLAVYRRFCNEYGFMAQDDMKAHIGALRDVLLRLEDTLTKTEQKKKEITAFVQNHDLKEETDSIVYDMEALHASLQNVQAQKETLQENIRSLRLQMENENRVLGEIETMEEELEEKKQELETLRHRYHVMEMTASKLTQARDAFTARYMAPIRSSFEHWYSLLSGNDGSRYELDAGLNIRLQAYGRGRNLNTLSEGYRDLVGLCRRMAMIDAMYEKEKPFIVMDDPFTNLDDERMACAGNFVKEIAKDHQIIYMTCHESRIVE